MLNQETLLWPSSMLDGLLANDEYSIVEAVGHIFRRKEISAALNKFRKTTTGKNIKNGKRKKTERKIRVRPYHLMLPT